MHAHIILLIVLWAFLGLIAWLERLDTIMVGGSETRETELKIEMAKKQHPASRDLYTELTKLDNLRKNGILTEAEYNEQKKKILDQHK